MDKRLKAGADLLTGESYKPLKYEAPEDKNGNGRLADLINGLLEPITPEVQEAAAEIDRQATEGQRELQRRGKL